MAYKIQTEYSVSGEGKIIVNMAVVSHDAKLIDSVLKGVYGNASSIILGAFSTREDAQLAVDRVLEKTRHLIAELRAVAKEIPETSIVTI